MAVKLRLMRMGKKKQPTYRVVAADSRKARNGRFIEIVGTYNPRQEPSLIEIDNERALHWLRHGAQPSERVQKLLVISGAWEEFTGEAAPAISAPAKVTKAASAESVDAPAEDASAEAPDAGSEPGEDSDAASAEEEPDSNAETAEAEEPAEEDAEKAEDGES
ncbi:MAG: 30S ribosomal protein S16 [bacterium]|nr:30S ribosomal protein S16 [bacterium]MYB11331.1 30S ribosomal protein S16 [Acidimicrobiia bacterium]MYG59151.1 30S ribosomal protein S16 [Acidimicrobiia bacterium]MYJ33285.1 30S ribosomal protein S16 [Acidimicrobiia bacterium]